MQVVGRQVQERDWEWRPEAEICEKETEKKFNRDRTGQTGLPAPAATLCRQRTRVTAPGWVAGEDRVSLQLNNPFTQLI